MIIFFRAAAAVLLSLFFFSSVTVSQSITDAKFSKGWLGINMEKEKLSEGGPSVKCDLKILERPGIINPTTENIYLLKDVTLNKLYGDTLQITEGASYQYYNLNEVAEVSFKKGDYSFFGTLGGTVLGAGIGMIIANFISDAVFSFKQTSSKIAFGTFVTATLGGGITGFFIGKNIPKYKKYSFSELDPSVKKDEMLRVIKENQR